jgi:hypothetical protein
MKTKTQNAPRSRWFGVVLLAALLLVATACGSGYEEEKGTALEDDGEVIGTLTGVIEYDGEAIGNRLVVGLMNQWPMTGPPVRFWDVPDFDGTFPATYQLDLDEYLLGKSYFISAFLDVDPDDVNLMMNSDLDPMCLPKVEEEPIVVEEGVIVADMVLLDPEDVDYWWEED